MRDKKALIAAGERRPTAYSRGKSRPLQIDRRIAAEPVTLRVGGPMTFMRAPAQFRRLHAFFDECIDGPGVDELVARLAALGELPVLFSDVNRLDVEALREHGPIFIAVERGRLDAAVLRHVDQRLFDESRSEPRVRALRQNRCRAVALVETKSQHRLAQCVIAAP